MRWKGGGGAGSSGPRASPTLQQGVLFSHPGTIPAERGNEVRRVAAGDEGASIASVADTQIEGSDMFY